MSNLSLNVGDFETIREQLVNQLKATGRYTEYDFEGSNMAALLDVLAYNAWTGFVRDHIAINETFRSSAKIRHNVIARAQEVNYVPRSFRSAVATIRVVIKSDTARGSIAIPKGTMFTTRVDNRLFTFTTSENNVAAFASQVGSDYLFTADLVISEGAYTSDTFVYRSGGSYKIANANIDTTSLTVTVIEDGGKTVVPYRLARDVLDINSTSAVYFLGNAPTGEYQIEFGDGTSGRKPKPGSTVVLGYRASSGRLPNGASVFTAGQAIDGETNITVTTIHSASSGDVYESNDQIKFNASSNLRTQERGAGEQDYQILLQRENSDIIDVIATGGEKLSPPQYGRVFLSIASTQYSKLPESRKNDLVQFLRKRSMMEPVIVDPEILYLSVHSNVSYDPNATNLTSNDIRAFVAGKISAFADENLGRFASRFVRSKFVASIDSAHPSITGNDTTVTLTRRFSPSAISTTGITGTMFNSISGLTSSAFIFENRDCRFALNGNNIVIIDSKTNAEVSSIPVGTVDLATGEFQINKTSVQAVGDIRIIGSGYLSTIETPPNTILKLNDEDVIVSVL